MERRWGSRKKYEIEVILDQGGGQSGLIQAKTKDISFNGAFIRLTHSDLKVNGYIGLQFWDKQVQHNPCINVGAVVVYESNKGVGVLFNAYDERFRRYLRGFLKF